MTNNDILQVKKMLHALLKSEGLVEWVGGYVYGATSNGDPFIILYPAAEHLKEKVCRVYPHQFKKLPSFIPTANIVGDTDNNPSKDKAQRAGIYHECPAFQIVMHLGKDTQMGREKRFGDVLAVRSGPTASQQQNEQPAMPQPAARPSLRQDTRSNGTGARDKPVELDKAAVANTPDPTKEALSARGLTEFAVAAADVVGTDTGNVVRFLVAMFGDSAYWPFAPEHNKRYLDAVVDGMADRAKK